MIDVKQQFLPLEFSDTTVVVPTLNEENSIGILISKLLSLYPGISIIVSDDGSGDRTGKIVNAIRDASGESIFFLDRSAVEEKGLTASVCDGLRRVKTEYAVVMDGDLQHPPSVVGELVRKLRDGSELSIGVRKDLHLVQLPHRVLFTFIFTLLAKCWLRFRGINVRDPMSGLFAGQMAYFLDAIEERQSRFEARGYKILFDLLRTGPRGQKTDEVLYRFSTRVGGGSKASASHAFCFLRSLFK